MSRHVHILFGAALLVVGSSCVKEVCRESSPRIELNVGFDGDIATRATRLEVEVHLKAPGLESAGGLAYVRAGQTSMSFPEMARQTGSMSYVLDPGKYVRLQGTVDHVRVFFRAYYPDPDPNPATNRGELLLGEGIYASTQITADGCFRLQTVSVTSAGTCQYKIDGSPCVHPSGAGVCKGPVDALSCQASACGGSDDYADLRGGEICDPSQDTQAGLVLSCTDRCLPVPRVVTPTDLDARDAVFPGQVFNLTGLDEQSTVEGFYALERGNPTALGDRVGRLILVDVDGDAQTEMILGVPGASVKYETVTKSHVGAVFAMDQATGSGVSLGTTTKSRLLLAGAEPRATDRSWFGASIAAGDVNGDGIDDLVVGAPMAYTGQSNDQNTTGAAYLFHGGDAADAAFRSSNGSTGTFHQVDAAGAGTGLTFRRFQGTAAFDSNLGAGYPGGHLGYAVAIADLDLDGYADIIVSEPDGKTGSALLRHGRVYVMRGSADWMNADAHPNVSVEEDAAIIITNETPSLRLGTSLAIGDLNGDGYPDVVIGSAPTGVTEGLFTGSVSILFGAPPQELWATKTRLAFHDATSANAPFANGALVNLTGDASDLRGFGATVAVVDLDGDGIDDLAVTLGRMADTDGVAETVEEPSRVVLINGLSIAGGAPGAPLTISPDHLTVLQGPPDAGFGIELHVADVNGDRRRDLVIGAPLQNTVGGGARAGAIYVLYATPRAAYWALGLHDLSRPDQWGTTPPSLPVVVIEGSAEGGWYGTALGTSSHFSFALESAAWSDTLATRRALSYVLAGGVQYTGMVKGEIQMLHLPGLFCCGNQCPCPYEQN